MTVAASGRSRAAARGQVDGLAVAFAGVPAVVDVLAGAGFSDPVPDPESLVAVLDAPLPVEVDAAAESFAVVVPEVALSPPRESVR